MSGKGGKDFSTPRGKSSDKTPTSKSGTPKGKKDWSSKVNPDMLFESPKSSDSDPDEGFLEDLVASSERKVSSETPKSGKRPSLASLKTGEKEKTGVNGKIGKSGKSNGKGKLPTEPNAKKDEADLKLEIKLPENAEIIMDCEAASILQGIQDFLPSLQKDPLVKVPASFHKALEHANNGDLYTNPELVREILQKLKSKGITDGEICMISRVCPGTINEAFALLPSLKANKQDSEGPIKEALDELVKLKKSMES